MAKCAGCGKTWAGLAECHCLGCHEHFKSISAFDMHRANGGFNDRQCLTPEEMQKKGMVCSNGKWVTKPGQEWLNLASG